MKQRPWPIATASRSGIPNVVYVGFLKTLDDETILIADNYFNKTAANLKENQRMSILCYDAEAKKCYQIKGSVSVLTSGPIYEDMRKWVHDKNPKHPAKAAVVVKVEEIFDSVGGPGAGKKIA